ncbi:hypothetical protein [Actinospica sp.]|uniref:hypothetical protein n=1 Tax=Actinospica sp. TaxID=1872142 RepID=UPI002D029B33|nr:hypothetical protein [Actinospica sp.]HWG28295.1 hypothetical protein [Actinospica sp.]
MDAMQNNSASATVAEDAESADIAGRDVESVAGQDVGSAVEAPEQPAEEVPQPRSAEPEPQPEPEVEPEPAAAAAPESGAGKGGKKRKSTPKPKTAATKSLVVFREGKVHYADESVVVLDLDDAAHPETDVHDVVDKLSELRDAVESPGRAEAVTLIAELIQAKALA